MKKILLSLLLAGGVQNSFAMHGGGGAAQSGAASSASAHGVSYNLEPDDKALINAARTGNFKAVQALLTNDADINLQDVEGMTALMFAALNGMHDVVKLLVDKGADVNLRSNKHRETSLMYAAGKGHLDIVKMLLDKGADVNLRSNKNKTAADYTSTDSGIDYLLKNHKVTKAAQGGGAAGSAVTGISANNKELIDAAERGDLKNVRKCISGGADVNVQNAQNTTALMLAAQNGHVNVVDVLIANKSDVNLLSINGTALMHAAQNGHVNVVDVLIANKSDVNLRSINGTALIAAVHHGNIFLIKKLIDARADINLLRANRKDSALIIAAENGHIDVVRELIANGAHVNLINCRRVTALMIAAEKGHVGVVRELIKHGAEVNLHDFDKRTALLIAARNGHVEVLRVLLEKGAEVNFLTLGNRTALMVAARKGHDEVVRALIEHGANLNLKSSSLNKTALDYAFKKEILLQAHKDRQAAQAASASPAPSNAAACQIAKGGASATIAEQPRSEFLIPIASRSNVSSAAGESQAVAMPVAPETSLLQELIYTASNRTGGLFDLCAELMRYLSTEFDVQEAASLFQYLGFATQDLYDEAPLGAIFGRQLGLLLSQKIISFCGGINPANLQIISARSSSLNQRFAQYAQEKSAAGKNINGGVACESVVYEEDYSLLASDTEAQTDEPVQIPLSGAQKRFAPSTRSAFTTQKPKTTAVPTGDASATTAEQPSFEIMRPIARRPQGSCLPSMQPAMAQPAAPQVFPLQHLILTARANGTGFFGLIQLLNCSVANVNFDAHQAEALFIVVGLDSTVFADALYADITGLQLAEVLRQNIIGLCGHDVYSSNIPGPEQSALMSALNQRFASYAQTLGN